MSKFGEIPDREPDEESATEKQLDYLKHLAPHLKRTDFRTLGKWQASYLIDQAIEAKEELENEEDNRPARKSTKKSGRKGCSPVILVLGALALWYSFKTVRTMGTSAPKTIDDQRNEEVDRSPNVLVNPSGNERPTIKEDRIAAKELQEQVKDAGQRSPSPTSGIDEKEIAPVSPFLKSLEGLSLPASLMASEPISLLNAAGKEVSIPVGSVIKVVNRSNLGTLTMKIDGGLFVGNETRLSGKVRLR